MSIARNPRPGTPFTLDGCDCIRVPLSKGLFAIIDAADAAMVLAFNWYADCGQRIYAARRIHNPETSKGTKVYMHRFIFGCGDCVDHRNNDGLDNRRANLRSATTAQNMANRVARNG